MPGWWPEGEPWPPPAEPREAQARRFPIRIALLFALIINLVGGGLLALARVLTGGVPWPLAWPVALALLVMATATVFVVAMRRVGAPLSEIVVAAGRVGDGDLSVRLDEQGQTWLRSVANAFNLMTSRLQQQQRERQALLADIAHELRTPVAVIQGRVEGMLDGVYPRDEAQVRQVLEQTRVLSRLVEDLRTSAHAESGTLTLRREMTDLGVLLEDAADALAPDATARGIRIETDVAADVPLVDVDPFRMREVFVNLLSNAVRHSPEGGRVRVDCTRERQQLTVRVMDDGPGIVAADLDRIFERFYKGAGSTGSGLGLPIARSLVRAHGGTLTAGNREGGGAVMRVVLPV